MDNAQKAIMVGVGLFITIIIIAAVMLITGMGQELITGGQTQVSNISASLQAQLTSDFDNSTITGAQVVSAIKRYYQDDNMVLAMKTATNSYINYGKIGGDLSFVVGSTYYTITNLSDNENPTSIGGLSSPTDTNYVPSTAKYNAKLIKVAGSDNIVGIVFEKES